LLASFLFACSAWYGLHYSRKEQKYVYIFVARRS
jgi:hypothetical protein